MNIFPPRKYTTEELLVFVERIDNVSEKILSLLPLALRFNPRTKQGAQFYLYGIRRRLFSLIRENYLYLTQSITPFRDKALTEQETNEAALHLNSFYFHLWGSIDNMAWVIAYELKFDDMGDKPSSEVGNKSRITLFPNKGENLREWIKENFSLFEMQLLEFDNWIKKLSMFRHPTAHRIPLFVVPYFLTGKEQHDEWDSKVKEYERLLKRGVDTGSVEIFEQARVVLDSLEDSGHFFPIFAHEHKFNEKGEVDPESLNALYPTIIDDCEQLLLLVEKCTTFLSTIVPPEGEVAPKIRTVC